jgi:hypothetical protein
LFSQQDNMVHIRVLSCPVWRLELRVLPFLNQDFWWGDVSLVDLKGSVNAVAWTTSHAHHHSRRSAHHYKVLKSHLLQKNPEQFFSYSIATHLIIRTICCRMTEEKKTRLLDLPCLTTAKRFLISLSFHHWQFREATDKVLQITQSRRVWQENRCLIDSIKLDS